MRAEYGTLPFYTATEDTIEAAIIALSEKKARTTWAKRGMAHIRKYHDELPALTRLAGLYRRAIEEQHIDKGPITMDPVTFHADIRQMRFCGKFINFPYTTDKPILATKMRVLALRYPTRGIVEVAWGRGMGGCIS